MQDNNIPPAEADEFSRAFDLYVRLDEVKAQADAARLRLMDADRRTSALECEARERLVEATEAKVANIEAELEALKASHQGQDAEPRADEAQPVAAPLSRHAHQEDAEPTKPKRESNIRQAEVAEAEVERVRAELQRPHELSELVPTEAKPDQGQAAPAESQGSRQRQRHDDLALELERILASLRKQGKSTAPHAVMDALKERAGRPDSCIAASVPEGVAWTRGTGKVETLNVRALARRLKNLERRESR